MTLDKLTRARLRELREKAIATGWLKLEWLDIANALVPLLDALDAAEARAEQLQVELATFKLAHEFNASQFADMLADARRAALEEAAGWLEDITRGCSSDTAMHNRRVADMLRERAVKP